MTTHTLALLKPCPGCKWCAPTAYSNPITDCHGTGTVPSGGTVEVEIKANPLGQWFAGWRECSVGPFMGAGEALADACRVLGARPAGSE